MGDFTGFTFNGIHTDSLNIKRVSNGSRYEETMIPQFQDRVAQAPGSDGTYFFNSEYRQKPINVQIAFDSMTEVQLRAFKSLFNGRDIHELIFDESPYKKYIAKVQNPPILRTICFMEDNQRIYKGEGTINFICYYPFARSVYKYGNEYSDLLYPNKSEWITASGLLSAQGTYDGTGSSIKIYNPGDFEADWTAFYAFSNTTCALLGVNIDSSTLNFKSAFTKKGSDTFIGVDSKTQLISGYTGSISNLVPSGNLYNEYINSGDFFKIPIHRNTSVSKTFNSFTTGGSGFNCSKLVYDYIYY